MSNIARLHTKWHDPPVDLPPDAIPICGPSTVFVEPDADGWTVTECSESGAGILSHSLTKREAMRIAFAYVEKWNAELHLMNKAGVA